LQTMDLNDPHHFPFPAIQQVQKLTSEIDWANRYTLSESDIHNSILGEFREFLIKTNTSQGAKQ